MSLVEFPGATTDTRPWHAHSDRAFRESRRADCTCAAIERRHVNAVDSVLYLPPGIPNIADSNANVRYSGRGIVSMAYLGRARHAITDGRIAGRWGPVTAHHG